LEIASAFQIKQPRILADEACWKMLYPKFFPLLSGMIKQIVHIDLDTIFLRRVTLEELFVSDIGLVNANQFMSMPWNPSAEHARFFGIDRTVTKARTPWINSGVFAVNERGLELCSREIDHYLNKFDAAVRYQINSLPDEFIFNGLAAREQGSVSVTPNYYLNFLAYFLVLDPGWRDSRSIVHFHSIKPHCFWFASGELHARLTSHATLRVNREFYTAVLMWCRFLHSASRHTSRALTTLDRMPLASIDCDYSKLASGASWSLNADCITSFEP